MKLLFENWREFLKEQDSEAVKLGVYVKSSGGGVSLALVNLTELKNSLAKSKNAEEFTQKIKSKEFYKNSLAGYISAAPNKFYAQAPPVRGGSGGLCYDTWSVKESIGRGFGKQLYNALLGWAAAKDIYITADRSSVTGKDKGKGAAGVWLRIDRETDDEVPPKKEPYTGTFDSWDKKETPPTDDDCNLHGIEALDKGYKNTELIEYFKVLENNLQTFFINDVEPLFNNPGIFNRLFGNTPAKRAERIKKKFISTGSDNFIKFMSQPL